jgi:hypothetical protein
MKTNCIICTNEVENWDIAYPENESQVHPIGGTVFRTYGHYGSSVFDPMDASYLEIVACCSCLEDRLQFTYKGINKEYKEQLDRRKADMDKLIDELINMDAKE